MVDWSAVPYPPWWIARASARRRELDAAVERLRVVVAAGAEPCDLLVYELDEFARLIRERPFVAQARREGSHRPGAIWIARALPACGISTR